MISTTDRILLCVCVFALCDCFVREAILGASPPTAAARRPAAVFGPSGDPQALLGSEVEDAPPVMAVMQDGTRMTYGSLHEIAEPGKLRDLSINSGSVQDADLALLDSAPQLDLFALPGFWSGVAPNITDTGLEKITRLRDVRYLTIAGERITDRGVAKLVMLKKLVDLDIEGPQVTDFAVVQLTDLPDLRCLRLRTPLFTDNGLAGFGALAKLYWLDVRGTRVSGTGFVCLGNRKHKLEFLEGNFTDDGIETISNLAPGIELMNIVGPQVTDASLAHLAKIKSLRHLLLEDTNVTERGARRLRKECPWLKDVERY